MDDDKIVTSFFLVKLYYLSKRDHTNPLSWISLDVFKIIHDYMVNGVKRSYTPWIYFVVILSGKDWNEHEKMDKISVNNQKLLNFFGTTSCTNVKSNRIDLSIRSQLIEQHQLEIYIKNKIPSMTILQRDFGVAFLNAGHKYIENYAFDNERNQKKKLDLTITLFAKSVYYISDFLLNHHEWTSVIISKSVMINIFKNVNNLNEINPMNINENIQMTYKKIKFDELFYNGIQRLDNNVKDNSKSISIQHEMQLNENQNFIISTILSNLNMENEYDVEFIMIIQERYKSCLDRFIETKCKNNIKLKKKFNKLMSKIKDENPLVKLV